MSKLEVRLQDNMEFLTHYPSNVVDLIYIDPPFSTGKEMSHTAMKMVEDKEGDRTGYSGKRYKTEKISTMSYNDKFDDFKSFIYPRMQEARRILKSTGSLFFHLDYREIHYCKIGLDEVFGRESFINEIIGSYDYGGRSKKKWSCKHDTILWYAKDPKNYTFNYDAIDRIPYLAPSLVGDEKAERGKTPTDVGGNTIVPTQGKERTGYPTQKPLGILNRIVQVHSNSDDLCVDFFAGSGSFGEACVTNNRSCILVDSNPQAYEIMLKRFEKYEIVTFSKYGV